MVLNHWKSQDVISADVTNKRQVVKGTASELRDETIREEGSLVFDETAGELMVQTSDTSTVLAKLWDPPIGTILNLAYADYKRDYDTEKWLPCDGREIDLAYKGGRHPLWRAYPLFFGNVGTSFNLPDMNKGRFIRGASGTDGGQRGGAAEVTLTINQIPRHNHPFWARGNRAGDDSREGLFISDLTNEITDLTSESVGGGQPHNNLPPYIETFYIIKVLP